MERLFLPIWLAGAVSFCSLTITSPSQAQITEDGTLSTQVETTNNLIFVVTGGKQVGSNLFHSFREFSVPTGGEAVFNFNEAQINNIFSRVTGGSISSIDGIIRASGHANLFLINPNGIIFGQNAQLQIGGSFIASTANQINFEDGTVFSANEPQDSPLLTVSIPIGLQFRQSPGNIINQSIVEGIFGFPAGLQVQEGKTIALISGNVLLDQGRLFAPGGRIEIGSVAGNSLVSLTQIGGGWALGYEGVQSFQDIQLSQNALIDISGSSGGGNINLYGRRIIVTDHSAVTAFNDGTNPGGNITLKASESVEVSSFSGINTNTFSIGKSGDITIDTRKLIVRDRSFIDTSSVDDGRGGNLTVNTSESVEIDGSGGASQLATATGFGGEGADAGNLSVTTARLILRDGGQITSSTFSDGNGGTVSINASESIEISGIGITETGNVLPSGLLAKTEGKGDGGILSVNTRRLIVRDGGEITVAALEESMGKAGNLTINASDSVFLQGQGSSLLTLSENFNPAGNLLLNTPQLTLQDGAKISASSISSQGGDIILQGLNSLQVTNGSEISATTVDGKAGNLQINQGQTPVNNVQLNGGSLTVEATGTGDSGNLTVNARTLNLQNNSQISASTNSGTGQNISLKNLETLQVSNSNITTSTQTGIAGNVRINSNQTPVNSVQITDGSNLAAQATQPKGEAGSVTVNARDLTVDKGASISASNILGTIGGDVSLQNLETLRVNGGGISATTVDGQAGNLDVNQGQTPANNVQLNGGSLTVEATGTGDSGNLTVNARTLNLQNNSEISASTNSGTGQNISLENVETLRINGGGISATTEDGKAGSLQINQGQTPVNNIELNGGRLTVEATGTGESGNLTINARTLNLQNNAAISASTNSGEGGDISLQGLETLEVNNSNISASTETGRAGNLTVTATESVQLRGKGGLSVEATEDGTAGNLTVETGQMSITDGAQVTVSSPQGQAGNLTINADTLSLNRGFITAETGKSEGEEGANITLKISGLLTTRMENESLISATANGSADGGNIDIDTPFLIVFPPTGPNGSDIIAKAERGSGGRIAINAFGIFGIRERKATPGNRSNDLDASSESGSTGEILLNRELDPNRGLVELPETVVDPKALVAQNVCKRGSKSEFTITGRGGLPPSLSEDLNSEATQVELVEPAPMEAGEPGNGASEEKTSSLASSGQTPIVPAQGWVFNERGEIVLVAYDPTVTGPQRLRENEKGCTRP